jgi:hypothetical protein
MEHFEIASVDISEGHLGDQFLLIAEAILSTAIRTLPGNAVTGHAPYIFVHAGLANLEPATASPAKKEFVSAAMTLL